MIAAPDKRFLINIDRDTRPPNGRKRERKHLGKQHSITYPNVHDVDFLPDVLQAPDATSFDLKRAARLLLGRQRAHPSPENDAKLESFVNFLLHELDAAEDLPDDFWDDAGGSAGPDLDPPFPPPPPAPTPPRSTQLDVFENAGFRPRLKTYRFGFTRGQRYRHISSRRLAQLGLHSKISALSLTPGENEFHVEMIGFSGNHLDEQFRRWHQVPESERAIRVPSLDQSIDDRIRSILLVRHNDVDTRYARAGSLRGLRRFISELVEEAPRLSMRGHPIVTWDMFPNGARSSTWHPLEPDRTYIWIRIPVYADTGNLLTGVYDAEIRLWSELYLDGGRLRQCIEYYDAWASEGWRDQEVREAILDELAAKLYPPPASNDVPLDDRLNSLIDAALEDIAPEGITPIFTDVYLLPGYNYDHGDTREDVTIALVPVEL